MASRPSVAIGRRVGLAIGGVVLLLVLIGGERTLLGWSPASDFYDAQGRALLDLRLDVPSDVLGIEAFTHDGRSYMYQPPWPAVLRLPVLAATDGLDGRLAQLSMVIAVVVYAVAIDRLLAFRDHAEDAARSWLAALLQAGFGLAAVAGATPVFLASRAWVYHESAMWGLAGAVAGAAALQCLWRRPTWARLAIVVLAASVAMLSRASVGIGPVVAAGLLALLALWIRRHDVGWGARLRGPAGPAALALAALVPVVAYAAVNLAKFDTIASVPWQEQGYTEISAERRAVLAANDGTLFGLQFAPTTLRAYADPFGIDVRSDFPFVDFETPGTPVNDARFDLIDRSASVPSAMPALVVFAVVGAIALATGRRGPADRRPTVAVLSGAIVASVTIIPFGYIANRYLADVVPALLVAGAAGLPWLESVRAPWRRRGVLVSMILLVCLSVWANVGLALLYQARYAPNPDLARATQLVGARAAVADRLGRDLDVHQVDELPPGAAAGDLFAVRGCEALYEWDGSDPGSGPTSWVPLERTTAGGQHRVTIDPDRLRAGVRYPLLSTSGVHPLTVWISVEDGQVVAGIDSEPRAGPSRPVPLRGRTFDVTLDSDLDEVVVRMGGRPLISTSVELETGGSPVAIGRAGDTRADVEATLPGAVAGPVSEPTLCRRLTG